MTNNNEEIKKIIKMHSFFLQNSHTLSYPHKDQNYILFSRTGLKKEIREKIPQSIKEKLGIKDDFIKITGEEKLKIRKKTLKLSKNLQNLEGEIGKKIALFLDKKAVSLLRKAFRPESVEITNKDLIDKSQIDKNYKLKFFLENAICPFNHDPKCIKRNGFVETRDLVFLINPKARPKKLLNWLCGKNKQWYRKEILLRHILKSGISGDPGGRDIATCSLVPEDTMFITYEYDALWLWFDIKFMEKIEKNLFISVFYCAKVAKKCVLFHPF
ncbi:MAG: hypothetical protein I3273_02725 [Candidatus Moeniiplasma glomeromycotorum]|nr:hypothetical protein [Candidatus Moeniiplasma glomeromycotorum]MCE8167630.1 hypothetical protein [Candidatus Moeniiplasma glomeromycotorum]MCE8169019.1 hypothetical protein [Candidatus Moeniiplasma glomeromycotorum]